MAGRKQHFIPQSLLKGFEASSPRKSIQVHVYRAHNSYLSSTEGVAAERDFYSDASTIPNSTLDDNITTYEKARFITLLNELRQSVPDCPVRPESAAEVISHLVVRSAFVRGVFTQTMNQCAAGATSFFSNEELVRAYMGIDGYQLEPSLSEELDKTIQQLRTFIPQQLPEHLIKRILLVWLREGFSEMFTPVIPQINAYLTKLTEETPAMIRNSHAMLLGRGLTPIEIASTLDTLNWTVIEVTTSNLILPDCVVISKTKDQVNKYEPYILGDRNDLEVVLMPLSSGKLLIGQRKFASPIEIVDFNKWAAECSCDFFVSSKSSSDIASLAKLIGTNTAKYTQSIVQESFSLGNKNEPQNQIVKRLTTTEDLLTVVQIDDSITKEHKYTVSFINCATQEAAHKIAYVVGTIFNSFDKIYSLGRVESITFASDFVAAINNIDRGSEADFLMPTKNAVALAPIVIRNGQVHCCIVFESWIGHALVDTVSDESVKIGTYTVQSMLARVALVELIDSTLPDSVGKPIVDDWNGLLFPSVQNAFSAYFSARCASYLLPSITEQYQSALCESVLGANEAIPHARLAYRNHGNLDAFLDVATNAVSDILISAARLIGHCDGLDTSFFDDRNLLEVLQSNGLQSWIEVYRRDLDMLHKRLGAWTSYAEFTQFTVHVERLLWKFSVFPWKTEADEVRVEIPLAVDAKELIDLSRATQAPD